ncbi:MAG: hypothetical protein ACJ76V_15910 [Thermoleophilaceae bacterium]
MARPKPLFAVLALALAGAFPAAAQARKDAWQYVSISGGYTYHAAATAPSSCATATEDQPASNSVLSRDHSETFKGVKFGAGRYVAKYSPAVFGPATIAQGQDATLQRSANDKETYRVIGRADDGSCTQTDRSCDANSTQTTREHPLNVFPQNKGRKLKLTWVLNLGDTLRDCVPKTAGVLGGLQPELDYDDSGKAGTVPYSYVKTASIATLKRRKSTYVLKGSLPVKAQDYAGTLEYNAKVVLKRVRIAESCKVVKRQGFTCSL